MPEINNMIYDFIDIYEPSGVVQLSNANILLVEDDASKPLKLLQLTDHKSSKYLEKINEFNFSPIDISDLEALSIIPYEQYDQLYAISSHSLNSKGKSKNNRNCLLSFTLKDQKLDDIQYRDNLKEWIVASYPELKKSTKIKKVQKKGGFNIEGLACDDKEQQLLIGLRSPLYKHDLAIIIAITITPQLFSNEAYNEKAQPLITLDLDGAGIRDMAYVSHLKGFIILSGTSYDSKKPARLWFWRRGKKAVKIKIKGVTKLGNAEGITPVKLHGQNEGILLVIDDGDKKSDHPGHYLFVSYEQLKM